MEIVYNKEAVKYYFEQSKFQKELILYLSLTNEDFSKIYNYVKVDFRAPKVSVNFHNFDWEKVAIGAEKKINCNLLHLRIRQDTFIWGIMNKMPWEDYSIGFQCRIDRIPDVYNVDFWNHFTNNYI